MRVISMRDVLGAARGAFDGGGVDGLSFSDNWDSMPLSDLDDALEGAGVAKDVEPTTTSVTFIPVSSQVVSQVKQRSRLLDKGRRG